MATVIGYGNLIDSSTVSGTVTNTANIKNRYLTQKASGAGYIDIDLGSAQSIGAVAAISITYTGTIRIQGGSAAGSSSAYDSTAQAIYGQDHAVTFPSVSARYWRITFSGSGGVGRIFIGPRFAPVNNIDWNPTLAVESKTAVAEALGGPEYFDIRPNRRVWQGKYSWLSDSEAYGQWLPVQRAMDVSGEVYLFSDSTETIYRNQKWFYGRLRSLSPIEYPYLNQNSAAVEIGELL